MRSTAGSVGQEPVSVQGTEDGRSLPGAETSVEITHATPGRDKIKLNPHWKILFFAGALGLFALIVLRTSVFNLRKALDGNVSIDGILSKSSISVAIERAQALETWLDDESLVAFIEMLERDPGTAEAYNALHCGSIREKWVLISDLCLLFAVLSATAGIIGTIPAEF
ncbi:hypothetical protein B0H17DRAFT_1210918 [Mycena rosella]|uniref:Uncharacterized protein n=1 Tax=Mycena rosella TaxID=1033263 RepID=A0AAD7G7V9_MYCRO|nr:hypothetical protein B0H17DRAFT_1210918 [Mycena rosella]